MKRTIIIKGDASKSYEEVIFIMKDNFKNYYPDLFLADKILAHYKFKKSCRLKNILECSFYFSVLILIIIIGVKIILII